jgi:quercetin dioxygenase-like cupin family protein
MLELFKLFTYKNKEISHKVQTLNFDYNKLLTALVDPENKVNTAINYKDVDTFPFWVWVKINRHVTARRKNNIFGNYMSFDNIVKKGGAYSMHFHDDIIESCEVISGKMIDEKDGKIYKAGDVMHYEAGIEHEHKPVALEDSILNVIFKPVNE